MDSADIIRRKISSTELTVSSLVREIADQYGYDSDIVIQSLIDLQSKGDIELHETRRLSSFMDYALASISLWFWTALCLVLASFGLVVFTSSFVIYLRYIFGSLLILFLPGYSLAELLDARKGIQPSMKIILSIGLSLAVVSLAGLVLNDTPYKIRPLSVASSLTGLTVIFLILALVEKYQQYTITKSG